MSARKPSDRQVRYKLISIKSSKQAPIEVTKVISQEKLDQANTAPLAGEAAGLDEIFAEFIKHVETNVKQWRLTVLTLNANITIGELPEVLKT